MIRLSLTSFRPQSCPAKSSTASPQFDGAHREGATAEIRLARCGRPGDSFHKGGGILTNSRLYSRAQNITNDLVNQAVRPNSWQVEGALLFAVIDQHFANALHIAGALPTTVDTQHTSEHSRTPATALSSPRTPCSPGHKNTRSLGPSSRQAKTVSTMPAPGSRAGSPITTSSVHTPRLVISHRPATPLISPQHAPHGAKLICSHETGPFLVRVSRVCNSLAGAACAAASKNVIVLYAARPVTSPRSDNWRALEKLT